MNMSVDRVTTRAARWLAVAGLASIVFGVIVLLWPKISLVALTFLFGAFAFVYGVFALGAGLTLLARRSTEWVPFIIGGVGGVILGVITYSRPGITDLALTYLIAAWAFITGVMAIAYAIDVWGEIDGALWVAISGVLSIVFGILVAFRPASGLLAILWLIGIYAILAGLSDVVGAYRVHQFHGEVKRAAAGQLRTTGP